MTRGIIVDLPRLRNVPYLEPGTPVYRRTSKRGKSTPAIKIGAATRSSCDRTLGAARAKRAVEVAREAAGWHASVMPWLKQRDVALLGNDAVNDVQPSGVDGTPADPPVGDRRDGAAASGRDGSRGRRRKRRADPALESSLTAAPVPVPGGTGFPLNPIATF